MRPGRPPDPIPTTPSPGTTMTALDQALIRAFQQQGASPVALPPQPALPASRNSPPTTAQPWCPPAERRMASPPLVVARTPRIEPEAGRRGRSSRRRRPPCRFPTSLAACWRRWRRPRAAPPWPSRRKATRDHWSRLHRAAHRPLKPSPSRTDFSGPSADCRRSKLAVPSGRWRASSG